VGTSVGDFAGVSVGVLVGTTVGNFVGDFVGVVVRTTDGVFVGVFVVNNRRCMCWSEPLSVTLLETCG
jgi:uncharacterized protein YcfJ